MSKFLRNHNEREKPLVENAAISVFDLIIFLYVVSTFRTFSNSSETIRTKGMKDQLCVRLATSLRPKVSCGGTTTSGKNPSLKMLPFLPLI